MSARTWATRAHFAIACLFVTCVAIQTFLIGLVLFNEGDVALHRGFGGLTFLVGILVPVSAGIARVPSRQVRLSAALLGVLFIQVFLASMKWSGPSPIAALHPVGALVVFALGVVVARRAWTLVKSPPVEDRSTVAPEAQSAEAQPAPSSARG
jgi:hypothetical protein